MAQAAFQADALQIEPGSAGVRRLSKSTAGNLLLTDPSIPSGITLPELAGLRAITGVLVVGRAGNGAQYTLIQDAIDAIPAESSATNPYVVLITPGIYEESLTIEQDGVWLAGLGDVTVTSTGSDPTLLIQEGVATVPQRVVIQGLTLQSEENGVPVISINGANTYASGAVTVDTAPLTAGDSITIGGVPLTGVAAARTPGSDNFDCRKTTLATMAAEIAAAINDLLNSFTTLVGATAVDDSVQLRSVDPGAGGNAITLAVSTGDLIRSGATLTGGGGVGTEVGSGEILIQDCNLRALGVGSQQLVSNIANYVRVQGGSWRDSSSTSSATVVQTARFTLSDVDWVNELEVAYTTASDIPSDSTCAWSVRNVGRMGPVLCSLEGEGSSTLAGCFIEGALAQAGDRTLSLQGCSVDSVEVSDTTAATLRQSTCTSVTTNDTATLQEGFRVASESLSGFSSGSIALPYTQPDTSYMVVVESSGSFVVSAKTTTGFTLTSADPFTGTLWYTLLRGL